MTENTNLKTLLKQDSVVEREGIFVDKYIADKTVWDKLAVESPEHAVISASSEEAVAEKSVDQIAELKADLPDGVILDLGCGYGRIAKYLLPQRSFGGYIGLDSAHEMVRLFAARYNKTEGEQGTPALFLNADIHTIPLQDNSVDSVVVAAVFLHNHKSVAKKSIDEIHRVLKPGGVMYVYGSFPNKLSLMGLQGVTYQMFLNLIGNPFKNGPVRYYSRGEVAGLLEDFSEVDIRSVGFALLPKRIIFFPGILDKIWRNLIANPINNFLPKVLPQRILGTLPTHHDVIAKK